MANTSFSEHDKAWFTFKKKYLFILSLVAPSITTFGSCLALANQNGNWLWFVPFSYFVLVPLADIVFGHDTRNIPDDMEAELADDPYYVNLLYVATLGYWLAVIVTSWAVVALDLTWLQYLAAILAVGAMHSLTITTGHELGHQTHRKGQVLAAKIVMASCGYAHFTIEHNRGHHKHVATPEDPASARMGESLYAFALRELPGAWKSGWQLEKKRLAREGLGLLSLQNQILQTAVISLIGYTAITAFLGWEALPFLIISSTYGWFQLTMANYIEHYGLLREKKANGRYQKCQPKHSWNSNFLVSNLLSLQLQRHSDHHANASRPYQLLRDYPEAPAMPTGYPSMMMLSMIPPLWFTIMNPKVAAWANYDMSKVNMHQPAGEKLFKQFNRTLNN